MISILKQLGIIILVGILSVSPAYRGISEASSKGDQGSINTPKPRIWPPVKSQSRLTPKRKSGQGPGANKPSNLKLSPKSSVRPSPTETLSIYRTNLRNTSIQSNELPTSKKTPKPRVWPDRRIVLKAPGKPERFVELIDQYAKKHRLPASLLQAIIKTESNFNPKAVSPKGACGLMQLMPEVWRHYGVADPFDAKQNISAGTTHFRELLDHFNEKVPLALAAYNAGVGAVELYNGIPDYLETRSFVKQVIFYWDYYEKNK